MIVGLAREVPREGICGMGRGGSGGILPPHPPPSPWLRNDRNERHLPSGLQLLADLSLFFILFSRSMIVVIFLHFWGAILRCQRLFLEKRNDKGADTCIGWQIHRSLTSSVSTEWVGREGGFCKRKERKGNYWRVNTEIGADMAHSFQSNKVTVFEI